MPTMSTSLDATRKCEELWQWFYYTRQRRSGIIINMIVGHLRKKEETRVPTMLQGQKAVAVSQVWLTMPRNTFVPVMWVICTTTQA